MIEALACGTPVAAFPVTGPKDVLMDADGVIGSVHTDLQVAAVHLAETPPKLASAQLVIDTLSAMINAGGERLGEHVDLYRNALAEVQQVFVRATSLAPPKD